MKIIKNFKAPSEASPYNPAKYLELQAGEKGTIEMNGLGGDSFGINRIIPYAMDMSNIIVSARLNEDLYLFRDVQLSVVHQLFRSIDKLYAPFVIQRNNSIVFELENKATSPQTVNIQLIGYDQYGLSSLQQAYNAIGAPMPSPRFLYGHATVQAGAFATNLNVKSKSVDVEIRRIAMSSDAPDGILASLKVYNTTVREELFIQQINDEFDGQYINIPFVVGSNVPFDVYATNLNAVSAEVSFLCESYVSQPAISGKDEEV